MDDQLEKPKIIAQVGEGKWIIEISKDGFKYNHAEYPLATADTFAQAFVDILERQFEVTMEKRKSGLAYPYIQELNDELKMWRDRYCKQEMSDDSELVRKHFISTPTLDFKYQTPEEIADVCREAEKLNTKE